MKLLDIKTYSRYYPSLIFERKDGNSVSFDGLQIIESLKGAFPGVKTTFYRTYGRLDENQESPQRIFNIIILPSNSQRQGIEGGIAKSANHDILAYRIQIANKYICLSCWQVSSHQERYAPNFHDDSIEQIWNDTKDKLVTVNEENRSIEYSWLDYLLALDALKGSFPKFNTILSLVDYNSKIQMQPVELILDASYVNLDSKIALGNIIKSQIIDNENPYEIMPAADAAYQTQLLTRFPVSVSLYLQKNDQYLAYVNSMDEALAMHMANVHLGFRSLDEKSTSHSVSGDSFSSLYHTFMFSRIKNTDLEIELIASLWKSIDNESLRYTYEATEWEKNIHYSAFFRGGKKLQPILRFATLALVIHDTWIRKRLETSIADSDLDQLLALISVPESCLSIMEGFVDTEFIDFPYTDLFTVIGVGAGQYQSALGLLVRLKYFESTQNKIKRYLKANENDYTRFLRGTVYYNNIQSIANPAVQIYINHWDSAYSSLINNVFVHVRDRKTAYLKSWLDKVRLYFASEAEEQALEYSKEITRIGLMTSYLTQNDLEVEKSKSTNEDVVHLYDKLLNIPPTDQQLSIEMYTLMIAFYWLLYQNVFITHDNVDAAMFFSHLKTILADQRQTDNVLYTGLVSLVDEQSLQNGLSDDAKTALKNHIINVFNNHINL